MTEERARAGTAGPAADIRLHSRRNHEMGRGHQGCQREGGV